MTAYTPIPRSVREAVLDLANAAEVLAETAAETLIIADAMRARWAKQQDDYYAAKDAANG